MSILRQNLGGLSNLIPARRELSEKWYKPISFDKRAWIAAERIFHIALVISRKGRHFSRRRQKWEQPADVTIRCHHLGRSFNYTETRIQCNESSEIYAPDRLTTIKHSGTASGSPQAPATDWGTMTGKSGSRLLLTRL
jgi:hypothetical protein